MKELIELQVQVTQLCLPLVELANLAEGQTIRIPALEEQSIALQIDTEKIAYARLRKDSDGFFAEIVSVVD